MLLSHVATGWGAAGGNGVDDRRGGAGYRSCWRRTQGNPPPPRRKTKTNKKKYRRENNTQTHQHANLQAHQYPARKQKTRKLWGSCVVPSPAGWPRPPPPLLRCLRCLRLALFLDPAPQRPGLQLTWPHSPAGAREAGYAKARRHATRSCSWPCSPLQDDPTRLSAQIGGL